MNLATARVVSLLEYGHKHGFGIERPWRDTYAIPAWEEMGLADLCGPFATATAAQTALETAQSEE
jgi:hypothetical protein